VLQKTSGNESDIGLWSMHFKAAFVATATNEGVMKEPCGVVILPTRAADFFDWCTISYLKNDGFSYGGNVDAGGGSCCAAKIEVVALRRKTSVNRAGSERQ